MEPEAAGEVLTELVTSVHERQGVQYDGFVGLEKIQLVMLATMNCTTMVSVDQCLQGSQALRPPPYCYHTLLHYPCSVCDSQNPLHLSLCLLVEPRHYFDNLNDCLVESLLMIRWKMDVNSLIFVVTFVLIMVLIMQMLVAAGLITVPD